MKYKQKTLNLYKDDSHEVRLLKITNSIHEVWYRVDINRKVQFKSLSRYTCAKHFAQYVQNIVLQLKFTSYG